MAQNQGQRQDRNAQQVGPSPEALAAFYKHRSESLRDSHTTTQQAKMIEEQKAKEEVATRASQGFWEYIMSALQGHPGRVNK